PMLSTSLDGCRPRLDERRRALFRLSQTLERSTGAELLRRRQRLAALVQTLEALGPRSVLERGYAIARDASGKIVKNGLDLKVGETLQIEFGRGSAQTRVLAAHGLLSPYSAATTGQSIASQVPHSQHSAVEAGSVFIELICY